jgi:hypothetical protein
MRILIRSSVTAAVLLTAAIASAQPLPAPAGVDTTQAWSMQAGYQTFSLRDISRSGRPPDASPISWDGDGPALTGRYQISKSRSAHLIDGTWWQARNFSYVGPTRSVAALADDASSRFDVRYEYRRYFWRDLAADGFDLGVGLQGLGSRTSIERHITGSFATTSRMAGGGGAAAIVARLRRWDRMHIDASWANGAIVSKRSTGHSGVPAAAESFNGGNFLSDTAVRVDWRLTRATRVAVTWRRYFEMYGSDHYSYTSVWQSLNVGMLYAR